MLNGAVCPVTLAVGGAGVALAGWAAAKSSQKPSGARFAAVTALIFALQMLNYPVQNGTSGHLVGAVLAVGLLNIPFAVLSMTIVLAVQAVFFGDGGVNALGANVLNMALIGAGLVGWLLRRLHEAGVHQKTGLALAAAFSVLAGAAACAVEVALSGAIALSKVMPAMLSVHALIGAGEAVLTVAVISVLSLCEHFWKANENSVAFGAGILAVVAAALSPFASAFPDGLEHVEATLSFASFGGWQMPAPFADYQVSFIAHPAFSGIMAGVIGAAIVFGLAFVLDRLLARRLETGI
jgi:cobalt/nickel transport system permease protein